MTIDERPRGDVVLLDLHGKITGGDRLIIDTIDSLVTRGVHRIVLNFADVSYMDSVGLSTIVRSHLRLRQHGGQLVLLNLPARIADLLSVTGLTKVFEPFNDESAAIRRCSGTTRPTAGAGD
ncbi:MAG TPA: STAS domain-containing protein [Vicinamibacterales bacterium]|nr:STAS domain-containing protein [Vicinamibacterales bacterium]